MTNRPEWADAKVSHMNPGLVSQKIKAQIFQMFNAQIA